MKVFHVQGQWDFDHLQVAERPQPVAGTGQIRMAMRAAALNYRDLLVPLKGYGSRMQDLPLVVLSDGVGVVDQIGPGVAGGNNRQTLTELQNYMSNGAKATLGTKYRIVPNAQSAPAGAKVLNLRAAITGVSASNEGMKWYEVVPIAAVVGATSAATGHRDQDTTLFIEAELVDARTNQTVVRVVRKLFGKTLENSSQKITANDFKAAIAKLNSDLQTFIR